MAVCVFNWLVSDLCWTESAGQEFLSDAFPELEAGNVSSAGVSAAALVVRTNRRCFCTPGGCGRGERRLQLAALEADKSLAGQTVGCVRTHTNTPRTRTHSHRRQGQEGSQEVTP